MSDRASRASSLIPAVGALGALTLSFDLVPVLIPSIVAYFGQDLSAGGWIYFALNGGFCAAALWSVLRRVDHRRGLIVGLSALALVNLAALATGDYGSYVALRVLAGVAMGVIFGCAMSIVGAGPNVPKRFGLLMAVVPCVSLLIPVAGWVTEVYGWQAAHGILAATAIGGLALVLPVQRTTDNAASADGFWFFGRTVGLGLGSVVLWAIGSMALWVFVGGYAESVIRGGPALTGVALGLSGFAGFGATLWAGHLSPAIRPFAVLLGLAGCATAGLWLVSTGGAFAFVIAVAVWTLAHWFAFVALQGLLAESVDETHRRGLLTFAAIPLQLGFAFGALIGASVLRDWGFTGLGRFSAAAIFASAVVALWAWRDRMRSRVWPAGMSPLAREGPATSALLESEEGS